MMPITSKVLSPLKVGIDFRVQPRGSYSIVQFTSSTGSGGFDPSSSRITLSIRAWHSLNVECVQVEDGATGVEFGVQKVTEFLTSRKRSKDTVVRTETFRYGGSANNQTGIKSAI